MTAQVPYSVKQLHGLVKRLEVLVFNQMKKNNTQEGRDKLFAGCVNAFLDMYQTFHGDVKLNIEYIHGYSFTNGTDESYALATKDLIQQAITTAAYYYTEGNQKVTPETIEYNSYRFFAFTPKEQEPAPPIEKTIIVKENNTDEILRAIARSEEQAANFNKTLPGLFPKSKEYDAELNGLKQELEKMRDYFTLLQQKTEQIINEFNISTKAVNQLIDKAGEENRQLLNQMLQKEYNPVITVEAPEVKMPEIPAPKVEVNVMQVAEEIRVSLRAIVKHLDERLDKISEPKEVTFRVVYDKDKWPVEVVVKEIN